ncbi:hypothetical protein NQU47_03795 [Pseudoalteromonas distincta]|uniref:hypothetical protein n=1 Tax=Pseudoalteromonas distincta TaxID=77608 RepID=UPI0023400FE6|nr:hypothetical protein [Pseudoalteromonas distincta]MDC3211679.1 hypothetical protein [Pseudoalteromonas distincta]
MKLRRTLLTSMAVVIISGCNSTPEKDTSSAISNLPNWVLNPEVSDGIAATDCVKFSGNLSVDKKLATASSRLALAQQIETRVEGLEKNYSSRVDSNEERTVGTNFSSVSKQLTKQKLQGSRVIKSDIINIAGKDHFCVLTAIEPLVTKSLFDDIIKQSNRSINPKDEKFLYQEFKAFKAEENLDKEIKKLTN